MVVLSSNIHHRGPNSVERRKLLQPLTV